MAAATRSIQSIRPICVGVALALILITSLMLRPPVAEAHHAGTDPCGGIYSGPSYYRSYDHYRFAMRIAPYQYVSGSYCASGTLSPFYTHDHFPTSALWCWSNGTVNFRYSSIPYTVCKAYPYSWRPCYESWSKYLMDRCHRTVTMPLGGV